jgi:hypothetical protein
MKVKPQNVLFSIIQISADSYCQKIQVANPFI